MSTNGMTSWGRRSGRRWSRLPLSRVGSGNDCFMCVFWLYWHVRQMRDETRELEEAVKTATNENMAKGIDRY